jgi:YVTN family beta-propeller protein
MFHHIFSIHLRRVALSIALTLTSLWLLGGVFITTQAVQAQPADAHRPFKPSAASPAVIATVTVGSHPEGIDINPTTNRIYVANRDSNNVSVIDGVNNTVVATVSVALPDFVGVNQATNRIYVASENSNIVSVIDGTNNTVATTVTVGPWPSGIGVNPATNRIYVGSFFSNTVSVIDGANDAVVATILVDVQQYGGVTDIGVNPITNRLYVSKKYDSDITVIDTVTNTVVATVPMSTYAFFYVAVNPTTNRIYATYGNQAVYVIDGASNTVDVTIPMVSWPGPVDVTVPMVSWPGPVGVNPITNRIYVANGSNTIAVIDGANNTVVATATVGSSPSGVGVNPASNRIYVANSGSNTVSVIQDTSCVNAITVQNAADDGPSSLRQAIADVCPGGVIDFNLIYPNTITLTSSQLDLTKNLTLNGPGAANLTVSGNNARRVFNITSTVTISGVTISNGHAGSGNFGGGIYNYYGTLTLINSTLMGNIAKYGGGIANRYGTLTVTGSTFSGNGNDTGGGIINAYGTVTVTNSNFSGNSAANGGGINNNSGTMTVKGSTFFGNSAANGGGIMNWSTLTATNNTFSGNSATDGGGVSNGGTLNMANSTFSGNLSPFSGGIENYFGGTLTLYNTLVANSTGGPSCYGTIGGSNNMADDAYCGTTFTYSPSIRLGALGNYGGSTQTFPLLPGSAAIDAGNDAVCPTTDQRGVTRPQGQHCDIGAFEYQFVPGNYTLTIGQTGNGDGTVTANPPGPSYAQGTAVTLTAIPLLSSTFTGWSGDVGGTGNPITVTMNTNKAVTATFTLNTYVITPTAGTGGSITPAMPQTVNYGATQTFTITPNAGYHIDEVGVDGVSQGAIGFYAFTNVTANHTISAAFATNTYVITPTAGANGTLTPATPQTLPYGASQAFTIAPNTGYHIDDVDVDGVSQGAIGFYTFTNVTASHTLSAAFAINIYTLDVGIVAANVGDSVLFDQPCPCYPAGTIVTLTAVPGLGSRFTGWMGDVVTTTNPLTLTMDSNKAIIAIFASGRVYLPIITR